MARSGRSVNAQTLLQAAVSAAQSAGQILRKGLLDPCKTVTTKSNRHDAVTQYDRLAEEVIVKDLSSSFPTHGIRSEEGTNWTGDDSTCWTIDPLDGTNNFLRALPFFAVSIAASDRDGPLVACVYDPCREEMFTAVRGRGAALNGVPISVSPHDRLDGALLAVGYSTVPHRRDAMLRLLPRFSKSVRGLRVTGSAALDLAYVAAGRFDLSCYLSLHEWDVAAGRLLVAEAGGLVSDLSGDPLLDAQAGCIACTPALQAPFLRTIGNVRP